MHHSRQCHLVIDCHGADLEQAAARRSRALGHGITNAGNADTRYAVLDTPPDALRVPLQRVDHDSRVHLDLETDDLEAEAARLEALGATRIQQVQGRW
ncbi:VOC family protein [Oleiagrimonas sp. C23AA]|uniref:VOC family protein n=1 Tax=Oleiagrimonas sp. C23AA TaxID=2719047 RepID=UPI00141FD70C|nr:VOC family protein [Oleiagrimonas sp. C23AA]